MKNIRKYMKTISILMSISILFVSCNQYDDSLDKTSILEDYSGKELFTGILFARGDVANLIPSIKNSYSYFEISKLDIELQKESDIKIEELLNFIDSKNPEYFKSFKENINSKNHLLMQETLKEGVKIMFETSIDLYLSKSEKEQLSKELSNINIKDFTNDDGTINHESLKNEILNNNNFAFNEAGKCWFLGVVLVAVAYVLVVHAAAAMTYVAVAWVAEAYAAIDQATAITRDGNEEISQRNISEELLISEIVSLN